MCVVSVLVLAEKLFIVISNQSLTPGGVMAVIWIVITYHFISVSYKGLKEERSDQTHHE